MVWTSEESRTSTTCWGKRVISSPNRPDCLKGPPNLLFSEYSSDRSLKVMITYPLLVAGLRIIGAAPSFPHVPSWRVTGADLVYFITFVNTIWDCEWYGVLPGVYSEIWSRLVLRRFLSAAGSATGISVFVLGSACLYICRFIIHDCHHVRSPSRIVSYTQQNCV
jgi:hypothetical protein